MLARLDDPQHKVYHDCSQQQHGQRGWAKPIVKASLSPDPDRTRTPMIRSECIYERANGDAGETEGGDLGGTVSKVKHAHGEGANDDGEVEPGEECTLVCEVNLGLDTRGKGDALA